MWFRSRVEAKRVVNVFGTVASLKIDKRNRADPIVAALPLQ